jgi:hypothetical protein
MGSNTDKTNRLTNEETLIIGTVLKHVMSSACKIRNNPLHHSGRTGTSSPPPTPLQTGNTITTGYSNGKIKQKRTRAMDMRFYWEKTGSHKGNFMCIGAQDTKI